MNVQPLQVPFDLDLRDVARTFYPSRVALESINAHIAFGETVAIVGPSGSGKSTLLTILGLLDRPTSGTYLVGGVDTADLTSGQRTTMRAQQFGFVFQAFHLVPYLTARENVELALTIGGYPRASRSPVAQDALRAVGLEANASTPARALSGGEQQRVAIARAVVRNPSVLFCDEPTGNLDSANAEKVLLTLFPEPHASVTRTTIVVTHNPEIADRCDRVFRIVDAVLSATTPARRLP